MKNSGIAQGASTRYLKHVVDNDMWKRCAAPGCRRYVPAWASTNAIYCSRKCTQLASSIRREARHPPELDTCGCGKPKRKSSNVCMACSKKWSVERDRVISERA